MPLPYKAGSNPTMTLPDFLTGLELELRLRAAAFDRGELEAWAADVWPRAEDDPDVIGWAEAFLAARQAEGHSALPPAVPVNG
jgi:hypothetical protein